MGKLLMLQIFRVAILKILQSKTGIEHYNKYWCQQWYIQLLPVILLDYKYFQFTFLNWYAGKIIIHINKIY